MAAPPAGAARTGHVAAARWDRRAGGAEIPVLGEGPASVGQTAATSGPQAGTPVPSRHPIGLRHCGLRPGGRCRERVRGPQLAFERGVERLVAAAARAAVHDRGSGRPLQPVRNRMCGHGRPLPAGITELRCVPTARVPAALDRPCAGASGAVARLVASFPRRRDPVPRALPALASRRGSGVDRAPGAVRRLVAAGAAAGWRR